jgi:hypothetical protein
MYVRTSGQDTSIAGVGRQENRPRILTGTLSQIASGTRDMAQSEARDLRWHELHEGETWRSDGGRLVAKLDRTTDLQDWRMTPADDAA